MGSREHDRREHFAYAQKDKKIWTDKNEEIVIITDSSKHMYGTHCSHCSKPFLCINFFIHRTTLSG